MADTVFDYQALKSIIPHRYPFLLIDRVTLTDPDNAVGIKSADPPWSAQWPGFGAEKRRIGQLPLCNIFPSRLSESGRIFFDVEQIVDDLKCETGGVTVAAQ